MDKYHLVVGLGEVGSAIKNILKCDGYDAKDPDVAVEQTYDVIHICFPFSDTFVADVYSYKNRVNAQLVIVHSSVPIGTCDAEGWIHSPVRGVHPDLELGIRTFVKYFGGARAYEAADHFARLGIKVHITDKAANTEALKLWDTSQYGVMIALQKQIYAFCQHNGLDFDLVYTAANETYNIGYQALGRPEVVRPFLKQKNGPIGGHCVMQNIPLLQKTDTTPFLEELIRMDRILKQEIH